MAVKLRAVGFIRKVVPLAYHQQNFALFESSIAPQNKLSQDISRFLRRLSNQRCSLREILLFWATLFRSCLLHIVASQGTPNRVYSPVLPFEALLSQYSKLPVTFFRHLISFLLSIAALKTGSYQRTN